MWDDVGPQQEFERSTVEKKDKMQNTEENQRKAEKNGKRMQFACAFSVMDDREPMRLSM